MREKAKELKLQYDKKINISVGQSRKTTVWKARELLWSTFVKEQMAPTRTRETVAEYKRMSKAEQSEVKDTGGYVGGTLKDGRRKSGHVGWRSILTLDMDFAKRDFWKRFVMIHDFAALIYTTHSHTADSPRYRLIIPLARTVLADEYQAIGRKVAEWIDIDLFDDTTFEPERLMFHSSCSADADFFADVQDGPWLDPNQVLEEYSDWRDVTEWPLSSRAESVRLTEIKKQGDPLSKRGLVGAFNRAYSVEDAIETFLPEIYSKCDIPHRYTFVEGSTAGGLIIYDDGLFAYSHHGTDPISGKLVSAYDLVRLHLFGDLDEDAKEGTPITRLPSTKRMVEILGKDKAVTRELSAEQTELVKADFSDLVGGDDMDDSWLEELSYSANGTLKKTIDNAVLILENDPLLKDRLRYDVFAERYEIVGDLPWTDERRAWSDADDACLQHYMEKYRGYEQADKLGKGLTVVMQRKQYHPVRDYFSTLTWNGVERLDTVLMDYLGTEEDTPYIRAVTRKTLVAAVKRIFEPGCKFDYVLTLTGAQGIGKSSILRRLAGDWLQETMPSFEGKEASEQLRGYMLVELSELGALRKSEVEVVKGFITRTVDSYRVPYGKRLSEFPRQCVFIATTNASEFINDGTGGRRWWPVKVTGEPKIKGGWTALTQPIADQIWAEAIARYKKGEKVYLDDKTVEEEAIKAQRMARKESDKLGIVEEYLDRLLPEDWDQMDRVERRSFLEGDPISPVGKVTRDRVCIMEIWEEALNRNASDMKRMDADELHGIMQMMDGWKVHSSGSGRLWFGRYGSQKAYVRTEPRKERQEPKKRETYEFEL